MLWQYYKFASNGNLLWSWMRNLKIIANILKLRRQKLIQNPLQIFQIHSQIKIKNAFENVYAWDTGVDDRDCEDLP